ncbi:MAG: TonB-dependent receptor plug domain-containing protein, partial [Gemmatimonadota bacterium]
MSLDTRVTHMPLNRTAAMFGSIARAAIPGKLAKERRRRKRRGAAACVPAVLVSLAAFAWGGPLSAQAAPDTVEADSTRVHELERMVVVATRSRSPLAISAAAVSRLTEEELDRLPVRTAVDALRHVPGLTFLDFEGTARDPQLATRGFYGGGESEYAVVLLDGRPLNGLEAGLVDWDLIPVAAIDRIEVLRGGASSLYGDAAIGAVVNIVTDDGCGATARWGLSGDAFGGVRGEAGLCARI